MYTLLAVYEINVHTKTVLVQLIRTKALPHVCFILYTAYNYILPPPPLPIKCIYEKKCNAILPKIINIDIVLPQTTTPS
jgi:hypothetical protein